VPHTAYARPVGNGADEGGERLGAVSQLCKPGIAAVGGDRNAHGPRKGSRRRWHAKGLLPPMQCAQEKVAHALAQDPSRGRIMKGQPDDVPGRVTLGLMRHRRPVPLLHLRAPERVCHEHGPPT
jgi:hypothetical protein